MATTPDLIARHFMDRVSRYGYRRSCIDDVARELRVSKKTIYTHFPSKAELRLRGRPVGR